MKFQLFLNLVIISIFFISNSEDFSFYGYTLSGEKAKMNEKSKTIIIINKQLQCSTCEYLVANFINQLEIDTSISISLLLENNQNVLINSQKMRYYKSFYATVDNYFFTSPKADTVGHFINIEKYKNSDFPIIIMIDNRKQEFTTYLFNEIAEENKKGLTISNVFKNKVIVFLND